jgi:Mce-associated membrane protein
MPPDGETTGDRRPRRLGSLALLVPPLLALAFVIVAAVLWERAAHDPGSDVARARDAALVNARIDVATVNTLDYHNVGHGLSRWLAVTTGTLHQQIAQATAHEKQSIAKAHVVTTATVVDAAVTAVDPHRGTATVIASVDVRKTPSSGRSVTSRNRFSASMREVGGRWRLASLTPVQVKLQ